MTEEEFKRREKFAMVFLEVAALVTAVIIAYILFA